MRKALVVLTTILLLIPVVATAQNNPPVADAGEDQIIVTSATVLEGTATDPDGDPIVAWLWSVESAPAGSSPSIQWPDEPDPSLFVDLTGDYVFSLTVFDGVDWSDPDFVTVQRRELLPPVAVIEVDVTNGHAPLTVQFDGSDSTVDPFGGDLTYTWSFGDGNFGAGITATHEYEFPGLYLATLTVVDELGQPDQDTIEITVTTDNGPCSGP